MKIRTQLILAFLLLSVLPLTGIVLYSYVSSQRAVRLAQHEEAKQMAMEMDRRVTDLRDEVTDRVARLGDLPFRALAGAPEGDQRVAGTILAEMGDVAPFVESIEFLPADHQVVHVQQPVASEPPSSAGMPTVAPTQPVAEVPPTPQVASSAPPAPPLPPGLTSIVINVDEILRDVNQSLVAAGEQMNEQRHQEVLAQVREATKAAQMVQFRGDPTENEAADVAAMADWERAWEEWGEAFGKSMADQTTRRMVVDPRVLAEARERARVVREVERERAVRTREASEIARAQGAAASAPAPAAKSVTIQTRQTPNPSVPNQSRILYGKELQLPVHREGTVVGEIRPRIRAGLLIESILGASERGTDEIPFAIDNEGTLHAPNEPARDTIRSLGIGEESATELPSQRVHKNWVIATSRDEESGLVLGMARRIREPLAEVRRAAGRNFAYGLGLIGIALIGIVPIANHMSRDVELVTEGAERIAQGDLETELPVRSQNELGMLATAFNRMAHDLREHRTRLVEQERLRKEQEIEGRLLAADFERKSEELEQARRFQFSLLPKELPRVSGLELAVHMKTATEVGGDYYDFHVSDDRGLTVAVGDATGHGASAGTMVTIVKSLFSTYQADRTPSAFLGEVGETIRRMDLGRMAMALLLARFSDSRLTVSSAAMPPALVYRAATRKVEEISSSGMPLGSFGSGYSDLEVGLETGDTVLLMSDGFPELLDARGDPLGYPAVENAFRLVGNLSPAEIIEALARAAEERTAGAPPNDDITFVVVKAT